MRIVNVLAVLLLTLSVGACGSSNVVYKQISELPEASNQQKVYPSYPLSGKVEKILKGTTIQILLESENKQKLTVEVSPQAKVVFNSKPSTVNALALGQTLYIESDDSKLASKIVIQDWPGVDTVGKTVEISTDMVFERTVDFIRSSHPELGLPKAKLWSIETKETPFGQDGIVKILKWGNLKLRMIWTKDQTEPEYDAMLTVAGKETAVWSGRFRKDGKVLEERYEKP